MITDSLINTIGIGVLSAVVGLSGGAYVGAKYQKGLDAERFTQIEQAQKQALLTHAKEIAGLKDQQQKALYTAEKEKQSAIQKLNYDYSVTDRKRLYVSTDICTRTARVPTITTNIAIPDEGTAPYVELPEELTERLYDEAKRSDELAEDYRAVYHWLIYNGLYTE